MQGVSFSGRHREGGKAFVYLELFCGGMGARPTKDGVDYIETDITNMQNAPTEAVELEFPLRVKSMRLKTDSGGPGRYRGGLGMEKIFEIVEGPVEVTHRGDRHFTAPWGLSGGRPAAPWSTTVIRTDGSRHKVPARERFTLHDGEVLHCETAGGGGYGDPMKRPVEDVMEDVSDGFVSAEVARAEYGVVVAGNREDDINANQTARESIADVRAPLTNMFDRGPVYPYPPSAKSEAKGRKA